MFIGKVKPKASWVKPWKTTSKGEESASSAPIFLFNFKVLSVFTCLFIFLQRYTQFLKRILIFLQNSRDRLQLSKTIKNYIFFIVDSVTDVPHFTLCSHPSSSCPQSYRHEITVSIYNIQVFSIVANLIIAPKRTGLAS